MTGLPQTFKESPFAAAILLNVIYLVLIIINTIM
jgi:hypothetical protein